MARHRQPPTTPKPRRIVGPAAPLPDMTPTEDERRMAVVLQALSRGYTHALIVRIARGELGIGQFATLALIKRARAQLTADFEANKPFARAEQVARLRELISTLKAPRYKMQRVQVEDLKTGKLVTRNERVEQPLRAQDIMRAEEQLARIEGNEAPVKIEVTHALSSAAAALFANMNPDKYNALLERARTRKLVADTIDAPVLASDVKEGAIAE